jgi:hypothetical protein
MWQPFSLVRASDLCHKQGWGSRPLPEGTNQKRGES